MPKMRPDTQRWVSARSVPPGRARTLRTYPVRRLCSPAPGQATDPTSVGVSRPSPGAHAGSSPPRRLCREPPCFRGQRAGTHAAVLAVLGVDTQRKPFRHGCRWDCHDSRPGQPGAIMTILASAATADRGHVHDSRDCNLALSHGSHGSRASHGCPCGWTPRGRPFRDCVLLAGEWLQPPPPC
jgi:hypothetical protein